jgi:lipopolysaccharide/colanic/teichoic acid biosynthesis glycosyltransferase
MEQITATSSSYSEQNSVRQTLAIVSPSVAHEASLVYYFFSKRLIDITLSVLGRVLLMPIFLIIAVCIKPDDGGKILHFGEIIGQHGRRFFVLKFRRMIPDTDVYLAKHPELMKKFQRNMKLECDLRITRIGKFLRKTSLDELPQLFNVLVGQMSLVGPRMIHPSELPRYGKWARKWLSVRPGITGLWQISGRQHISYEERVLLDVHYIDNRTCRNDLAILFKTLRVFIVNTGA